MGCLGGCLVRSLLLISIVVAAVVGWFWGPTIVKSFEGIVSDRKSMVQGSPEIASRALERLSEFQQGNFEGPLSFDVEEVTSLLRYSVGSGLPEGTIGLKVEMGEGRVTASSRIAMSDFPELVKRTGIPDFLPDTVSISLEGSLIPLNEGETGFAVYGAQISFVPVPVSVIPQVLSFLGIVLEDGFPGAIFKISLPDDISGAYVLHDRLFLLR